MGILSHDTLIFSHESMGILSHESVQAALVEPRPPGEEGSCPEGALNGCGGVEALGWRMNCVYIYM